MPIIFPPLAVLPQLTLHPSVNADHLDVAKIVNDWLFSFTEKLSSGQQSNISSLFLEKESWFRDFVSFSWDFASHNGAAAICEYLAGSTSGFAEPKADQPGALRPQLVEIGGLQFVQAGFSFRNTFGTGRGVLRLANVEPEEWKAWTVFTVLERLNGQDELEATRAEKAEAQAGASGYGTEPSSVQSDDGGLQVLVVGAGQCGLALAAHLQNLGLNYLVVDKFSRPGDSWRARYDTVRLHTPIYTDHYPFLKYPASWPRYLDRAHVTKWMEHYEEIMGLNVRHSTLASNFRYNETSRVWTVDLQSKDCIQTVHAKHVVLATGLLGAIPNRPTFPGEASFKGQILHTSAHKSAALMPEALKKKITIIGSGTSAHDIAQDFVNHGAENVTMVQRGAMYVVSRDSMERIQLPLWNTPGVSLEDADLLSHSLPIAVARTLSVGESQMMSAKDKDMLDALEKAGMAVKRGDGDSLLDYQLIKGGHFYADQGACQMIIDGRIKVRQCEQGVQGYYEDGVILANGTKIESEVVILATGFELSTKLIERLMGEDVMNKVARICTLHNSQERIGVWKPTGVPGFWYMTGSFIWSRQFSGILALQIAAIERGMNTEYYESR
ncbi:hypothetical protein AN9242.2 [Aspergillus nidulans FGSC A4]|uniref:FAD/NAD(P)-binding domain-containing protein n=1 Tax=Emericella nidulans (strain FGSC A4 / ATCC 38163 / CBS 112.46 / NRRL 194 / M139) TaxID=227321 RepID=Q5AR38_EMENI|nr:hypothetical protein [Aspergillus nidulans FGSC A4]EAA66309.1 hypothetical protein AN9242.2 [Aspergillus nidulans FGSC A4]CBF87231.1 TPA: conserved hypothetical protein [Aspergillus nidulans FGSC A4]|eukprot:XP_682511.1 hypothetical protein AN9242.2 [Aspergillus nidulans FGSC A4]